MIRTRLFVAFLPADSASFLHEPDTSEPTCLYVFKFDSVYVRFMGKTSYQRSVGLGMDG